MLQRHMVPIYNLIVYINLSSDLKTLYLRYVHGDIAEWLTNIPEKVQVAI